MTTVVLSVACVLLAAATLTTALRTRHWRNKADEYKRIVFRVGDTHARRQTHDEYAANAAHYQHRYFDADRRLGEVAELAARLRVHADPDGLTAGDAALFADKLRHVARGEQP